MNGIRNVRMDVDQRTAVDVSVNAVVSAGAGSGKTTVLAERYLRLVREGEAGVENILTLTFTRKASAEMYERIHRRLLENQEDPHVADGLLAFDRAQISTLDSFCGQIARADSARFGIPPDFSTDEGRVRDLVERTALDFLLAHRREDVLVRLIGQNGLEKVWQDCFASLGRDYFHVARQVDFNSMAQDQAQALKTFLADEYRVVIGYSPAVAAIDPNAGVSASALVNAYARLSDWPKRVADGDVEGVRTEAHALMKIRLPGAAKKPDLVAAKEILQELRDHTSRVVTIADTILLAVQTRALYGLLAEYEEIVLAGKRSQGLLSFQDVMEMAVAVLRDNMDLRRYYQKRFSHIMIDEFQDNNGIQRDLLFLLAERPDRGAAGVIPSPEDLDPGKLFFVGDEKQSIYLFRGADVSVFKELSGSLSRTGGEALSLRTNYRSHPALIRFFNAMFPSIMAPSDLPFEARFEPLNERPQVADAATPFEPLITLLYRPHRAEAAEEEFLDRDDAEAYRLAEFIRRSVTGSPPLSVNVRGVIRPATYDDFAILLRSGSNQIRYERMLRLFDIPYSSQTIRSLFLEAPLNDLYAILQLAVYPYDRSAYAAVLRGPFAHLSDDAVVRILGRFERPFSEAPLKDLPTDNRKYLLATDLYADLVSRVDRVPIPELLRMLWYDYGYRYTLLRDPAHHTYLEYFDYFLALAESTDAASMAEFLDTVRPHLGRYEKLPELSYLPESTNGVQIMTIHKAKGLEFPVVILANTGNVGRREGAGTTPYYLHPEFGLTFNLIPEGNAPGSRDRSNYFYVLGREEREQREYAELKRLLYVGMTRAESHLVISGVHHAGNQKSEEALLNMILGALDNGGDAGSGYRFVREEIGDVSREEYFRAIGGSRPADIASVSPLYEAAPVIHRRVPRHRVSVTELNREHAAFKDDAESKAATQLKAIASDAVIAEYHVEAQFGTLCHHVLQMRIAGVYETPDDIPQRSLRNFRLDALEPEERTLLLKDAWLLADRFLASKTARLMEGALLVETEVPFVLRTEEEGNELMVRGQIDLLVARTDELVVIDFKTDRTIRDGEYAEQLSLYRQAAPDLVPPSVVSGRTSASPWVVRSELYYLRDFQ